MTAMSSASTRVAIVTGGAAGIGQAIVRKLASEGVAVAIADRDVESARALAAELAGSGAGVAAVRADVADAASLESMLAQTLDRFGRVDYLVNNAGILGPIKPFWECTDEEVERVYRLNVQAVFAC